MISIGRLLRCGGVQAKALYPSLGKAGEMKWFKVEETFAFRTKLYHLELKCRKSAEGEGWEGGLPYVRPLETAIHSFPVSFTNNKDTIFSIPIPFFFVNPGRESGDRNLKKTKKNTLERV